jgi:hypothetical protein
MPGNVASFTTQNVDERSGAKINLLNRGAKTMDIISPAELGKRAERHNRFHPWTKKCSQLCTFRTIEMPSSRAHFISRRAA